MAEQLSVGALINLLEQGPDDEVRVGGSDLYPGEIDSYRGYYEQLAIGCRSKSDLGRHEKPSTAHEFAADLREMMHATITGYKGGTYHTSPSTPIWVSNYGHASGDMVTGVHYFDGLATIETTEDD